MSNKIFQTRIMNKYDTAENWSKATFTPFKGELIIYAPDKNYEYKRVKIGDGETPLNSLPFCSFSEEEIENLQAQINKLEDNTNINSEKIDKLEDEVANIELIPGKDGVDGKDGQDGLSAYEIACQYGFEGSEEEWLDSLHGKDGVDGCDGKDGQDGYDGKDGVDGVDGKDGATPYIGDNGNWWIDGEDTEVHADYVDELDKLTDITNDHESRISKLEDIINEEGGSANDKEFVTLDTTQTITGEKTFSESICVGASTEGYGTYYGDGHISIYTIGGEAGGDSSDVDYTLTLPEEDGILATQGYVQEEIKKQMDNGIGGDSVSYEEFGKLSDTVDDHEDRIAKLEDSGVGDEGVIIGTEGNRTTYDNQQIIVEETGWNGQIFKTTLSLPTNFVTESTEQLTTTNRVNNTINNKLEQGEYTQAREDEWIMGDWSFGYAPSFYFSKKTEQAFEQDFDLLHKRLCGYDGISSTVEASCVTITGTYSADEGGEESYEHYTFNFPRLEDGVEETFATQEYVQEQIKKSLDNGIGGGSSEVTQEEVDKLADYIADHEDRIAKLEDGSSSGDFASTPEFRYLSTTVAFDDEGGWDETYFYSNGFETYHSDGTGDFVRFPTGCHNDTLATEGYVQEEIKKSLDNGIGSGSSEVTQEEFDKVTNMYWELEGRMDKVENIIDGNGSTGNTVIGDLTVTGNLRLKGSGNYGNKIYMGDGTYVSFSENTDDNLTIHANSIDLDGEVTIQGKKIEEYIGDNGIGDGGSVEVTQEEFDKLASDVADLESRVADIENNGGGSSKPSNGNPTSDTSFGSDAFFDSTLYADGILFNNEEERFLEFPWEGGVIATETYVQEEIKKSLDNGIGGGGSAEVTQEEFDKYANEVSNLIGRVGDLENDYVCIGDFDKLESRVTDIENNGGGSGKPSAGNPTSNEYYGSDMYYRAVVYADGIEVTPIDDNPAFLEFPLYESGTIATQSYVGDQIEKLEQRIADQDTYIQKLEERLAALEDYINKM